MGDPVSKFNSPESRDFLLLKRSIFGWGVSAFSKKVSLSSNSFSLKQNQ